MQNEEAEQGRMLLVNSTTKPFHPIQCDLAPTKLMEIIKKKYQPHLPCCSQPALSSQP